MTSINFKAACFDLDGTLIDTGPPHRAAERVTVRAFGFDDLTADHPVTFGTGGFPVRSLLPSTTASTASKKYWPNNCASGSG